MGKKCECIEEDDEVCIVCNPDGFCEDCELPIQDCECDEE